MVKNKAQKRIFGRKKNPQKAKPIIEIVKISVAESSSSPGSSHTTTIPADIGSIGSATTSPTIVCDLGSAWLRMGFASHRLPRLQIPSYVGRAPRGHAAGVNWKDDFLVLGEEAQRVRDTVSVWRPVKSGRIAALDSVAFLLDTGFRRLGALTADAEDLSGRNLLLALRPSDDRDVTERLFQTLMETYRPDGCHFIFQQPLALLACARLTGVVVDSGEGVTHVVPVENGHPVLEAMETINVGGEQVTDGLVWYLNERYDFRVRSAADRDAIDGLKERFRLVSRTPGRHPTTHADEDIQLPDGREFGLGKDRYMCAEPLFNPQFVGQRGVGVAAAVILALGRCPVVSRKEMARNIFPVGGNCRLKGFDERLQEELDRKYPGSAVVRGLSSAARQTACWSGGAALARSPVFAEMVVTLAEYEEEGLRAFRRKCL